jgi:hypothetical protein
MTPFVEWILILRPLRARPSTKDKLTTFAPQDARGHLIRILKNISVRVAADSLNIIKPRSSRIKVSLGPGQTTTAFSILS